MSHLTPAMDAALAADRALVTLLIEVMLPGHPLRLLIGSGGVSWGAKAFIDEDPTFGTLADVAEIEDGVGDEAPAFSFSMFPSSNAAAADLANPSFQGSAVSVWLAALSPITGLLIPDPELIFFGQLDVATLTIDSGVREVQFECVSAFELLLEDDEGARLSDAFHQSVFPGEQGFANVTGNEHTVYWGMASPPTGGITMTSPYYGRFGVGVNFQ